jgi:hypothetical protein
MRNLACSILTLTCVVVGASHCGGKVSGETSNDLMGTNATGKAPAPQVPTPSMSGSGNLEPPPAGSSQPATSDPGNGCTEKPGQLHPSPTADDFRAVFSRRWLSCGDPTITHDSKEVGFEANVDGTYRMLTKSADGTLQPNGRGGTYKLVPNVPSVWQVDFAGAAGALKVATITDAPRLLSMNEIGVFLYRYTPLDITGWNDDAASQTTRGTYTRPAACANTGGTVRTIQSEAEFKMLITRRWALCTDRGIGEPDPGRSGLEIRADGHYNVLAVDPANRTIVATDVLDAGTWIVYPNTPEYQITFQRGDGQMRIAMTSLTTGPESMVMDAREGNPIRYVPLN